MRNKNIKIDHTLHSLDNNYIKFSRGLIEDERLSAQDRNVYLQLLNQAWRKNAFVTVENLSEWCGISKPTANRSIKRLQQTDWLTVDIIYTRENDTPLKQAFYTVHSLSKSSSLYTLLSERQEAQQALNDDKINEPIQVADFTAAEIEQTFVEIGATVQPYHEVQLTSIEVTHIKELANDKGLLPSRLQYLLEAVRQYKERAGVILPDEKIIVFIRKLNRINKTDQQIKSFIAQVQSTEL